MTGQARGYAGAVNALLVLLASMRLTRLVVTDDVGQWWVKDPVDAAMARYERHAEARGLGEPWWWKYRSGLDCPFCVGFWLTLLVVAGDRVLGRNPLWRVVLTALATNYVGAHIVSRLDSKADDDDDH